MFIDFKILIKSSLFKNLFGMNTYFIKKRVNFFFYQALALIKETFIIEKT